MSYPPGLRWMTSKGALKRVELQLNRAEHGITVASQTYAKPKYSGIHRR